MDALIFKIVAVVVIFSTGIIGGSLPFRLGLGEGKERLFSLGATLGGGVFLGAGLIHMIPDAQEGLAGVGGDYPVPLLIAASGFVVVLMFEKVLVVTEHHAARHQETMVPYLLAVVLSVHSLIAGIALGAEETLANAVVIFIAIIAHKGAAGFALGVALTRAEVQPARIIKIVALFSIMTPLGILIGSGVSELLSSGAEERFEGAFDALAAGTFLYVATMDIIQEEFGNPRDRWLKTSTMGTGLGIMAVVAIWT